MGVSLEASRSWTFGPSGGVNALGSTGVGVRFNLNGMAREQSFYVETDAAATCSYQILTARTLTGASVVLSSGTLGTSAMDIVQLTGPLSYVFPRIKTLNSTANTVTVELWGN